MDGSLELDTEKSENYEVPTNIDLCQYQPVTIWCRRFGVNCATAPLTPPKQI